MFKNVSFKAMLAGGNVIILALVVLISTILFFSIGSLIESSRWVEHTHSVLEHTSSLGKSMVDMETGQRGFMLTGNDDFLEPYHAGMKLFEKQIEEAKELVDDNPPQVKRFERVNELKKKWVKDAGQYEIDLKKQVDRGDLMPHALKNVLEGKMPDGSDQPAGHKSGKDIMDDIRVELEEIEGIERGLLKQRAAANQRTAGLAKGTALYGTLLAILIGAGLIFYLSKLLFGQLGEEPKALQMISQRIADGDLKVEFSEKILKSQGTLAKSFSDMVTHLKDLISNIDVSSKEAADKTIDLSRVLSEIKSLSEEMSAQSRMVAAASEQSSSNMTNIASSVEEISSSINGTATAVEEMSSTISEISRNCQKESSIAAEANARAVSTNTLMKKLEKSADQVGKILEIISDIADQTNLLALNATIEAASAGEAGKGFAVVANEVKELAKQTAQATDQIGTQIKEMRTNTSESVQAIGEITAKIEEVNLISQTIVSAIEEQTATISEISRNVSSVSEATNDVSNNVQDSAKGLTEISSNIAGFDQSIHEINSKMGHGQKGISVLSDVASDLKKSVEIFKL